MPCQAGHEVLQGFVASPDDEVFNAVHVEGDDGVLAFVGEAVAVVGVAAPAGGVVPAFAVAGDIHVDAHDDGFLHGVANLAGNLVGPVYAFFEGDVLHFGDQGFGVIAAQLEVFHHGFGNPDEVGAKTPFCGRVDHLIDVNKMVGLGSGAPTEQLFPFDSVLRFQNKQLSL